MRVTCPTCAARYDVADGMIAPEGRHVQCTACHTRWFERPPARAAAALMGEDEIIARLEARGGRGPRPVGTPGDAAARHQTGGDFSWEGRETPEEEPRRSGPNLRLVTDAAPPEDAADADAAAPALETEAVVQEPAPAAAETAAAVAAPPEPSHAPEPASVPSGRRLDLMRRAVLSDTPQTPPPPERRRGSAALVVAMIVVALLAAAYLAAEDLADAVPALEPPLRAYMGAIDGAWSALAGPEADAPAE